MTRLFLAVVIALTGTVASAQGVLPKYWWGQDPVCDFSSGGVYYNKTSDNTVEVTFEYDYCHSYGGDVVIPREVQYDGVTYTVTRIGEFAFYDCDDLESVQVPPTVTSIGDQAFYGTERLKALELPTCGLESIEQGAFAGCHLESFVVPNSVKSIAFGAFQNSYSLKHVTFGVSVETIGVLPFVNYDEYVPLVTLTSLNPNPPTAFSFKGHDPELEMGIDFDKCVLYVPIGSKEMYAAADGWKDFKYIVEKDLSAESGITSVASDANNDICIINGILTVAADNTPVHVMTIDGKSVLNQLMHEGQQIELPANIYIVTTPSGSRKFLIR